MLSSLRRKIMSSLSSSNISSAVEDASSSLAASSQKTSSRKRNASSIGSTPASLSSTFASQDVDQPLAEEEAKGKGKGKASRRSSSKKDTVDEEGLDSQEDEPAASSTAAKSKKTKSKKPVELSESELKALALKARPQTELQFHKYIGAHVSMAGGIDTAPVEAAQIGASSFALFLKSGRQWTGPPIPADKASNFRKLCTQLGFSLDKHVLPHASYLINLGSLDPAMLQKSRDAMIDELQRCHQLGIRMWNFHPGSSTKPKGAVDEEEEGEEQQEEKEEEEEEELPAKKAKMTKEEKEEAKKTKEKAKEQKKKLAEAADAKRRVRSVNLVAESINFGHETVPDVCIVLENTAGGGCTLGVSFEELKEIIDQVKDKSRVGVCLDTCHMYAAGLLTCRGEASAASSSSSSSAAGAKNEVGRLLDSFDSIVGLHYLRAMHFNDCKSDCGSHLDRHDRIGTGKMGIEIFEQFLQEPRLAGLPFILETPGDDYDVQIKDLKKMEVKVLKKE